MAFFNLPPVKSRLDWRLDELRAKIRYILSPPEQVVFVPSGQVAENGIRLMLTPIPDAEATATPEPSPNSPPITNLPVPTRTATPTSLPDKTKLSDFRHEYQGWNNCGPATLAMALSFWVWKGDQYNIAPVIKPNPRDKNVMPDELADYVKNQTDLNVIVRVGGELDLLKRLLAAGYPVMVEKGFESSQVDGWMGHYEPITGFDDCMTRFTAQDSYMGPDFPVSYETMESNWCAFNFTYLVVYPANNEANVFAILGPQADKTINDEFAARKASDEILRLTGRDLYFAWFNRGSSLIILQDYAGAVKAYDKAFMLYASLPKKTRPWRMLWYQTGPYQAYFYSGRYQDVIDLATGTLNNMSEPVLEESYYRRALAKESLGDAKDAMDDLQRSLDDHPGFGPSLSQLQRLMDSTPSP